MFETLWHSAWAIDAQGYVKTRSISAESIGKNRTPAHLVETQVQLTDRGFDKAQAGSMGWVESRWREPTKRPIKSTAEQSLAKCRLANM
jgi:hypothetical protein